MIICDRCCCHFFIWLSECFSVVAIQIRTLSTRSLSLTDLPLLLLIALKLTVSTSLKTSSIISQVLQLNYFQLQAAKINLSLKANSQITLAKLALDRNDFICTYKKQKCACETILCRRSLNLSHKPYSSTSWYRHAFLTSLCFNTNNSSGSGSKTDAYP